MKFTRESNAGINIVRAYANGQITIGEHIYSNDLIVTPDVIVDPWVIADIAALTVSDIQSVIDLEPEIVLLGTGEAIRFPDSIIQHTLLSGNIGFEVMDTAAACRTYNVLAHEDRRVAAALILTG